MTERDSNATKQFSIFVFVNEAQSGEPQYVKTQLKNQPHNQNFNRI